MLSNSQHAVLQQQQQQQRQQQQQQLFCQIKYKLKINTAKEFKGGLPEAHTLINAGYACLHASMRLRHGCVPTGCS